MNEEDRELEVNDGSREESGGELQAGDACGGSAGSGDPVCRLYRWYPPLLVTSTVMAGVFCLMYVTKPVFIEAPAQVLPELR